MRSYQYDRLTTKQAALVEQYHNLIYNVLRRYSRDPDDDYDAGAIGLCKAAQTYPWDNPPCTFAAWAYNKIRTEIANCHKAVRRHSPRALSLDAPLPGTEDFTLADTIPDYTDFSWPEVEDLYHLIKAKELARVLSTNKPRNKYSIVILAELKGNVK